MFDLPMKTSAADLAAVPVPLPGRVMMFAGPGGAPMVRTPDGGFRGFRGYSGLWAVADSGVSARAAGVNVALLSVPFAAGQLAAGALVPFRLAFWVKPVTAGTISICARIVTAGSDAWVSLASVALAASGTNGTKKNFVIDGMATVSAANLLMEFCGLQSATTALLWGDAPVPGVVAGAACTLELGILYTAAFGAGEVGTRSAWAGVMA